MAIRVHQDGSGNPVLIVSVEGGSEFAVTLRGEPYAAEYDEDGNELPFAFQDKTYTSEDRAETPQQSWE